MVRILLLFAVIFAFFYIGIPFVRALTNKEKWKLTKLVGYSALCTVLTVIVMTLIVILF